MINIESVLGENFAFYIETFTHAEGYSICQHVLRILIGTAESWDASATETTGVQQQEYAKKRDRYLQYVRDYIFLLKGAPELRELHQRNEFDSDSVEEFVDALLAEREGKSAEH